MKQTADITYSIHPEHVSDLVGRLEKLAKRAVKLGVEPLVWTVGDLRRELDPETNEVKIFRDVAVTGTTPRFEGWHFIASLEIYGGELLVTTAPGETVPEGFDRRDLAHNCDHCRANRNRKQTYLLRHDDGRIVRVGSSCLKDFLGHNFPSGVARLLLDYDELGSFAAGLGGGAWGADLVDFLSVAAMLCRAGGYVSRTRGQDLQMTSTADATLGWFDAQAKGKTVDDPSEQDRRTAQKAADWALAITPDSDYLHNVSVVARAGFVTFKTIGIAASILRAAELAAERAARDASAANLAQTSRHFGVVGERSVWQATLIGCHSFDGQYGTTWIYKFATADGNAATWFSSRNAEIEIGTAYWLTGTVKKHDSYRGTAETHLTRCNVSTNEPPKPRKRKATKAKPKQNPNVEPGENVSIEPECEGECWVWGQSIYSDSSVLAGQCRRRRIECFETIEAAKAQYPTATVCDHAGSRWANREANYSLARSVQPGWFDPADAGETW